MAWTTPRTWVSGELVSASIMNTHIRDNLNVIRANLADDSTTQVLKVLTQVSLSLANNATATIGNSSDLDGFLFITADEDNASAVIEMRGNAGVTVEALDPSALFSITAATGSSTNIYWSGTQYTVENKRGATRTYRMTFIGSVGG